MSVRSYTLYICAIFLLACSACANRGAGPQGGPRDTIPPVVVKESPLNGTLHFSAKRIEVQFDEYIQLADIQKNVIISPPQQTPPEVKAIGKTLSVVFNEELQDSTTYAGVAVYSAVRAEEALARIEVAAVAIGEGLAAVGCIVRLQVATNI